MNRRRSWVLLAGIVAPLGAGCLAAQSARVLAPGKTQLAVGAGRSTVSGPDDDVVWHGTVMVRRGLARNVDGGLVLQRTPGGGGLSFAAVEPKVQLTSSGRGAASVALALGPFWEDGIGEDGIDWDYGGVVVAPTIFLGYDLAPTAELVFAPRLVLFLPDEGDSDTQVGASLGVRFTDRARTWAVHPDLAYLSTDDEAILTLGLSIAAGN